METGLVVYIAVLGLTSPAFSQAAEASRVLRASGYVTAVASAIFRSSFERPIQFADSARHFFVGADNDYDWRTIAHYINYVGGKVGDDVDLNIATNRAHSGNRSLYLAIYRISGSPPHRVQLQLNARTERKLYTSVWYYFPATFSLPRDNKAWLIIDETWETGDAYQIKFELKVKRHTNGDYYWQLIGARAFNYGNLTTIWGPYENTDSDLPRGRWFHLEQYQTRSQNDGTVTYWINDRLLFNVTRVRTEYYRNNSYIRHAIKLYAGNEGSDNTPYYCWADDLEVRAGMPPET